MSSSTSRYTADIDLAGVNDAHILAIGRVPAKSRVLDLGAADGSVARVLQSMGCQVWAVEQDPDAAESARAFCEQVCVGDLNHINLADEFSGLQFDVVLMLDILEHLVDPAAVLTRVTEVLAPGGWGVVSLPNVAHISLRLALLDGHFTYRDAGLLDRTHLRFFDREGVDALFREAGWRGFDTSRVIRRLGTTEIDVEPPDPETLRRIEEDPEAYTYQFVVMAAPEGSPVHESPPVLPAAAAQNLARDVSLYAEGLRDELGRFQAEIGGRTLWEHLEAIRNESLDRRRQLADLLVALKQDTERLRQSLGEPAAGAVPVPAVTGNGPAGPAPARGRRARLIQLARRRA